MANLPDLFDPLRAPAAPPTALAARIQASVEQSRAPGSTFAARQLIAALGVVLALVVGSWLTYSFAGRPPLRVDLFELPFLGALARLALLLLLAAWTTTLALAPGRNGLGSKVALLVSASALVAPLHAILSAVAPLRTELGLVAARELHPLGLPCGLIAVAVGLLVLGAFGFALRRAVPAAPMARAAAVGAAAGAWAGVALFLLCPSSDALHILLGHALPVGAYALLGMALLPRWLRP